MSEQDKSLLDEQASLVRAVYRALPEEEIPAELDRSILENAAAAIGPSSSRLKGSWLRWSAPLASAAVVLLVVAVVMQPQSQREVLRDPLVVASQYNAPSPPPVPEVPRMAAEKPNLTAIPKVLEEMPAQAREPAALTDRAPQPAALSKSASEALEREEGGSRALVMPEGSLVLQENSERERDFQSRDLQSMASAQEAGAPSAAADASISANAPAVATAFRKELRRAAPPAAAPVAGNTVNPALDISPALRVRLEKFSSERQKAGASAADATLDELRREYPGVDIDAALQALEQLRVEGAN